VTSTIDLRVGMRLSIPVPDGAFSENFSSTVRRIDRRGLLMDVPRRGDDDLPLKPGERVTLFVQVHGRMFHLETKVIEADLQVLLEQPREAERTDRREFYRLQTSIEPLSVELLSPEPPPLPSDQKGEPVEQQEPPKPRLLEGVIVDLSGGGVRLRLHEDPELGWRLRLIFELDGEPMTVVAEVIGTVPAEIRRKAVAHCRFENIARRDQDRIIRYIFGKQREYSQRGVA